MTYDVRDVANFTLDHAAKRSLQISNLALQKLLYFEHGWFYSVYEQPLIKNKFEAWQYGPVQRVIYEQFKSYGDRPLLTARASYIEPQSGANIYRPPNIHADHADFIIRVLEKYEHYTAGQLVRESHVEDGPWEYVWQHAEDAIYPGMRIPDALILDHFKRLAPILVLH